MEDLHHPVPEMKGKIALRHEIFKDVNDKGINFYIEKID